MFQNYILTIANGKNNINAQKIRKTVKAKRTNKQTVAIFQQSDKLTRITQMTTK